MTKDENQTAERILDLTMEIIYLLTGENYVVVKKSGDHVTHSTSPWVPEGHCRAQSPIIQPPPVSLKQQSNSDQKILELTNEILHLLNGEVPIRCEDVAVYFSLEEWEYLEGNKELYKEVKMEDHQPHSSLADDSEKRITEGLQISSSSPVCTNRDKNIGKSNQRRDIFELNKPKGQSGCVRKVVNKLTTCKGENCISTDISPPKEHAQTECTSSGNRNKCDQFGKNHKLLSNAQTTDGTQICSNSEDCFSINSDVAELETGQKQTMLAGPKCENNYSWDLQFVVDQKIHTEKPVSTLDCETFLPNNTDHSEHQIIHTQENTVLRSENGNLFSQNTNFVNHQRSRTGKKQYVCSECGKCFSQNANLVMHKRIHTGEKPFACSECGKCFSQNAKLLVHQRLHSGEKPFACSDCGECFNEKTKLVIHQRLHNGEKPFACPGCGKCFSRKEVLVRHLRIHTGEKPFSCSECGKCFTDYSTLLSHKKFHTEIKPFVCSQCGKSFTQKSDLIRHQRIHTGEKPHACYVCGKCFIQKVALVRHQRIHTGEKPYACHKCGKCFCQKEALVRHQIIHTGEKPYVCHECGKCFTQKVALVRHQKIHTG